MFMGQELLQELLTESGYYMLLIRQGYYIYIYIYIYIYMGGMKVYRDEKTSCLHKMILTLEIFACVRRFGF